MIFGPLHAQLTAGLLGGAVYVNAFMLISKEVPPQYRWVVLLRSYCSSCCYRSLLVRADAQTRQWPALLSFMPCTPTRPCRRCAPPSFLLSPFPCPMQGVLSGGRLPSRQPGRGAGGRLRHPHPGLPLQGQRAGRSRLCLLSGQACPQTHVQPHFIRDRIWQCS